MLVAYLRLTEPPVGTLIELSMFMLLAAESVSLFEPVQLTESLMLILPLVPVPPPLLSIVTLEFDRFALRVEPDISPPVPTVKSVGSTIQVPPVPLGACVLI